MKKDHVVFDLDDLAEQSERNCLDSLLKLKTLFPQFKATLFAIPFYSNKSQEAFFKRVNEMYGNWIQLAIHGWDHHDNFECSQWSYEEAQNKISKAEEMGCFVKVFKAPGWQISRDTYSVCKNMGYIVADHKESVYTEPGVLNKYRRPKSLKIYEIDHLWMIHGHTWNCCDNGVEELLIKWQKEGFPWTDEAEFHFITELDQLEKLAV